VFETSCTIEEKTCGLISNEVVHVVTPHIST